MTMMVALMVISYLLTWFPYACVSIAETTGYSPHSSISYYILGIPTMLTKTSVCLDPIIYFWLNPQFKAEMSAWCCPSQRGNENSLNMDSNMASVRRYCSVLFQTSLIIITRSKVQPISRTTGENGSEQVVDTVLDEPLVKNMENESISNYCL